MRVTHILLFLAGIASHAAAAQRVSGPSGTVVVSNMNDNTAMLLDAATGKMLATLPTGEGPHEVAVSHDGRWAVVSNYGVRGRPGNSLTLIDVAKRAVARTLSLGERQRPHGMAFLPGDTTLLVTSEAAGQVLMVDVRTGTVTGSRGTGGRGSHMLSRSTSGRSVITGNISDGTISVIDLASQDSGRKIRVAAQPEGVAISPDGKTAWAGSNRDSVVLVVDIANARVTDTLRGFGLPYRIVVSADGRRAVITDPVKAEVRVFDAATRRQLAQIAIPRDSLVPTAEVPGSPSPEGVAVSPDGRWAFVTLQGRNRLATIDLDSGKIIALAVIGNWSDGVAFIPAK